MKRIFIVLGVILFFSLGANAQVKEAVVGVDGFTCSLCAKGVEGQRESLDFIKSVKTNLKATTFTLTFVKGKKINLSKLEKAITDGGFTLRDIKVKADGTLAGDAASGFSLNTGNSPNLNLKNAQGSFDKGDAVSVSGMVTLPNTLNVSTIKKK